MSQNRGADTPYPIFMLSICIIGDVLKGLLSALMVTWPAGFVVGVLLTAIYYIWLLTMGGFDAIKDMKRRKRVIVKVVGWSAFRSVLGLLPFVSLIPWTAISVHRAWVTVNEK